MNTSQLKLQLLRKVIRLQKLNLLILWVCGIMWLTHIIQDMLFTPMPWVVAPFPVLVACSFLCRRRINTLKDRCAQIDDKQSTDAVLPA
ncbi:hypothetical protein RBE51_18300 [Pseudomonas taiwanensis]|uniref:hypothetical protein n=1 Tax=Pseudomonas taiwanensis TaxID=470150 RepID=UPI0028DEBB01|nr:hypothetical protein [Pseudomonas taiwanensis]MDT8924748.1 hypothetical protein [Pseudomonas taiwanensis]